jgi:hypothetical protein
MMYKAFVLLGRFGILTVAGILGLILGASAAQAQGPEIPPKTGPIDEHTNVSTVEIFLSTRMNCAVAPQKVWVVVDDLDKEVEATPIPGGWTASTRRFDAVTGHISLRLGSRPPARTGCRKASSLVRDPKRPVIFIARFTFPPCQTTRVQQVTIHTQPPTPSVKVSYVRLLGASDEPIAADTDDLNVDCAERLALDADGIINAVRYQSEKLHLQIDRDRPDPRACGFLVNDLAAAKYAVKIPDGLVFEKRGVVDALRVLRSKAKTCAAPSFSAPASEFDYDRLDRAKLTELSMTVKPQPELGVK